MSTGTCGGNVFRNYVLEFGPRRDVEAIRSSERKGEMTQDDWRQVGRKHMSRFYVFVLQSLSNMGKTADHQRFMWTVFFQGRGLSSNGCIVTSRLGLSMPYSTYKLRVDELQQTLYDEIV
jgi:hypothetical protein